MGHVFTVFRREFASYFTTPLAVVFLIIFLMLQGVFTFYVGRFYVGEQADLSAFFSFHPWLYLFLMPAIGMRLVAEERRSGTLELVLTLPLSPAAVILGKYLAAFAFAALALALTFPIWLTVNYLGAPDNGVILTGYLGSLLMAGAYLGVAMAMSALTGNQVVAFIAAVAVCFLMTVLGLPMVLDGVRALGVPALTVLVASMGFLSHFDALQKGVVSMADLVYFTVTIAFWLGLTRLIIEHKREAG